jgi:hypothetical protein
LSMSVDPEFELEDPAARQRLIDEARNFLQPKEVALSREDLLRAAQTLRKVFPYNFEAWRLHADILLNAIRQLETRQLQTDPGFTLLAVPLKEDKLRDAAESALRECAHLADSNEKRFALIDEANRVRRETWF